MLPCRRLKAGSCSIFSLQYIMYFAWGLGLKYVAFSLKSFCRGIMTEGFAFWFLSSVRSKTWAMEENLSWVFNDLTHSQPSRASCGVVLKVSFLSPKCTYVCSVTNGTKPWNRGLRGPEVSFLNWVYNQLCSFLLASSFAMHPANRFLGLSLFLLAVRIVT